MQIWVDADFILEALLNRRDFSADAKKAFEVIQSGQVRGNITQLGLEKIYSVISKQAGNEAAAEVVAGMQEFLEVCLVDETRIQEARLLKLKDPESAIEVACALANGNGYILTLCPENFLGTTLHVWSVERLLNFKNLELSWSLSDLSSQFVSQEVEPINLGIAPSKAESAGQRVKLSNFLKGVFPEGWQAWEEVFETKQLSYRFHNPRVQQVKIKKFELGGCSLALAVKVDFRRDNEVDIGLQLYALDALSKPIALPINSQLIVLDDSEEAVIIAQSKVGDIGVNVALFGNLGESFSVKIEQECHSFIEYFII
jgi:predicted nucleic acid-binding protein